MQNFITYIAVALLAILIVMVMRLMKNVKLNYPYIQLWVEQGINIAEQLFPEAKSGATKKAWVVDWISKMLHYQGSNEELSDLIDASVHKVNDLVALYEAQLAQKQDS